MADFTEQRVVVITGACGGMGRAIARQFGPDTHLVLTDVDPQRVESFAESLREEGYSISAALAGSIEDDDLLSELAGAQRKGGRLGALIHTAGLSPVMADWQTILRVNFVATEKLLRAFEPNLVQGSVGILIASIAGHYSAALPGLDALLADPLDEDLYVQVAPFFAKGRVRPNESMEVNSYAASKRGVIRICERRAPAWAKIGARIVSISPGAIFTPMARKETLAFEELKRTPIQRWGTSMDISAAVQFLISDAASFITGADLRIDGGLHCQRLLSH